ncbi:MAG: P44/Msp2 family outer membrane protein, partial [Alteraurantiacibacter sp.]
MRKLLLSASAVALAVPGVAHADPYIAISGGLSTAEDYENTGIINADIGPGPGDLPGLPAGTSYSFDTNVDVGWNVGGQIGYDFDGPLRVELEGSYVAHDIDYHSNAFVGGTDIGNFGTNVLTRSGPGTGVPVFAALADGRGDVESYGAFLNVLFDFDLGIVEPYVGAGAGIYVIDVDYLPSGLDIANDADTTFAYQGIAGVAGDLGDNVELFAEYKYRRLFDEATVVGNLIPSD